MDLINEKRIDLIIGIDYVEYYDKKYDTKFFEDLYIEHKKVWNNLKEDEWDGKESFIKRFNKLIENIKLEKINNENILVIDNWLVNGFHRTSIAIYFNFKLNITYLNDQDPKKYNYYPVDINFLSNCRQGNLDKYYIEYIMYRYLNKYRKEFGCLVLFDGDKQVNKVLKLLEKNNFNILYQVDINNMNKNLIELLYLDEEWCKNGGSKNKSKCLTPQIKLLFLDKILPVKQKDNIRKIFKIGKDSCHSTDTFYESKNLTQLLNQNTVNLLKKIPSLYIPFPNFNKHLEKLITVCDTNNIDKNKLCIVSSAVLSVYGIRDCKDIDIFCTHEYVKIFKDNGFDIHDIKHYSTTSDDIIFNPKNYFLFRSFKFCTIDIVIENKKFRIKNKLFGEKSIQKDIKDLELIL